MSYKVFAQVSVLALFLLGLFGAPVSVQAGGLCGGTYIVDPGDTLEKIAATCGMAVSDIYTANPGISSSLSTGQTLNLAVGTVSGATVTFTIYNDPVPASNTYNAPPVYNSYVAPSYNGIYIVQYGDTFSGIASRFGVNVNDLWAANPYIWNINYIYAGQAIYVPGSSMPGSVPSYAETPEHLSAGTVPAGSPRGSVKLSNQANADVYVSLQGETRDGFTVINEYTVHGNMSVSVPAGWYTYVAWVGGQKFVGQFNLGGGSDHTITFYINEVVVQ